MPLPRVLLRSVEAVLFSSLELPRPILDIGCGDGHFSSVVFSQPLEAGIDPSEKSVAEARRRGNYLEARVGSATALPYNDGAFATVISNCVIEHIPEVEKVLDEAARVLHRGGLFVFTVPSENFSRFLFWSHFFHRLGFRSLASRYERWMNKISYLHHQDPPQVWQARLARSGFTVLKWHYYFSEVAMHFFDLSHYLGSSALLTRKLLGRWVLFPWKTRFVPLDRWLSRCCSAEPVSDGAYIFFLCRKD